MGSLIKSCSIGLADAAKLVVLLSKIDNHDKNTGKYIITSRSPKLDQLSEMRRLMEQLTYRR